MAKVQGKTTKSSGKVSTPHSGELFTRAVNATLNNDHLPEEVPDDRPKLQYHISKPVTKMEDGSRPTSAEWRWRRLILIGEANMAHVTSGATLQAINRMGERQEIEEKEEFHRWMKNDYKSTDQVPKRFVKHLASLPPPKETEQLEVVPSEVPLAIGKPLPAAPYKTVNGQKTPFPRKPEECNHSEKLTKWGSNKMSSQYRCELCGQRWRRNHQAVTAWIEPFGDLTTDESWDLVDQSASTSSIPTDTEVTRKRRT